MKRNLPLALVLILVFGLFSVGTPVSALDFFPSNQSATSSTISNFSNNLYYGMKSNDVVRLQNFLISHRLLGANLNTGFFGFSTFNALRAYQRAVGVPATGFFGPLTRTILNSGKPLNSTPTPVTATSTVLNTASTTPASTTTISTLFPVKPIVFYMLPTQGPVGSGVKIFGFGFGSQNTVRFGSHVFENVTANAGVISLTVPEYINPCGSNSTCLAAVYPTTAGQYAVSVQNTSGVSNTINFTVTAPSAAVSTTTVPVATTTVSVGTTSIATTTTPTGVSAIAQLVKKRACEIVGGRWSLNGSTATCMFSTGSEANQVRVQEFACRQWGGTYNMCLSSCRASSLDSMMCAAVCTPGCTDIR